MKDPSAVGATPEARLSNRRGSRKQTKAQKGKMATLQITLPDGATREVPSGTTAAEIAHQISPRLAKEALVARANGELIDLSRPLDHDAKLSILTAKDPDAVQVFRHSAAHLLAAAVLELYPDVKLGIGPPIEHRLLLRIRARPSRSRRKTSKKSKPRCTSSPRRIFPTSAS